ncbi:hypothetical protein CYD94_20025 (plasmid) [Ralstonia solanacearum]|nr:hypothetical protein AC251_25680 [Ralstonia pseudosolanacearum]AUS44464.1 hypothetical protein CYD94_20025 [Ralstonia solanacearum]OIT14474.1 hypothetical protein BL243_21295 [Ralstonia solanacearum]RNM06999.1 hypothetical protein EGA29_11795 [Ralstonia pseudosolanacearum]TXD93007.1 hypothetical protein FUT89_09535 [Ralstonia pseudosolanacearum]
MAAIQGDLQTQHRRGDGQSVYDPIAVASGARMAPRSARMRKGLRGRHTHAPCVRDALAGWRDGVAKHGRPASHSPR